MGSLVNPGLMAAAFRRTCFLLTGVLGCWATAGQPSTIEDDWLTLIALYESTNGEDWKNNSNWSTYRQTVPSPEQLGSWYGVTVTDGRVTGLRLLDNNLAGPVPPELGSLAELRTLTLSQNHLTGMIPPELGQLVNLMILHISWNALTGPIPLELADLAELRELSLRVNKLTGSIPPELGQLVKLEILRLSSNGLTGSIPPELGRLAELEWLTLGDHLTGSIPGELGRLVKLESLDLDGSFTGPIPPELGSLAELRRLALSHNNLTGSIPDELGRLTKLESLYLGGNDLTGPIPSELGALSSLQILALGHNSLTGSIPGELGRLTKLESLDLSYNALTGSIPPEIGGLSNLQTLWCSNNKLTGSILPEIGQLAKLEALNLGHNALTGPIPPELGRMADLRNLWLGANRLTGPIPRELGQLVELENFLLNGNALTGPIPPELGSLTKLETLWLNINQFTGPLPMSLTQLGVLDYFTWYENDGLCAPLDAAFQEWLAEVRSRDRSASGPNCKIARLSIDDIVVEEDNVRAVFTVSLDEESQLPVTVQYATMDGTATAGTDYQPAMGELTIPAGEMNMPLPITVIDDVLIEGDETFTVTLSNPVGAVLEAATGRATIRDNDIYRLSVANIAVDEAGGPARFTVTVDPPNPEQTVSVRYATMDGTAEAGADYTAVSNTLAIAPGQASAVIAVPILDDDVAEEDETFALVLSGVQHAQLSSAVATGTIRDDDAVPVLSIDDVTVGEEAGDAIFTVSLSAPSRNEVAVNYATADETATAGADYSETSGTLRIAPGEAAGTIRVPILSDELDEESETFLVRLTAAQQAEIGDAEGRGTITDDDEALTVSILDGRGVEDAGILHLPVRLSRASTSPVSVRYGTSDIAAESGLDYTSSQGFIVFERGSTEGVVAIAVHDDQVPEEEEEFRVALRQPLNAAIAQGMATGTIVDNDGVPRFRVGDVTVSEGEAEAVFVVTLSAPSVRVVTAAYRTVDGTAEAGKDYVTAAGTLEFAPGETQKEVRVKLLRSARDWRAETFLLALGSISHAGLQDVVATATIVEDESVEQGVRAAYLSRFVRTSASHVVDALGERLRWQEMNPSCVPMQRESLQMLRYVNPAWQPSAGELLSGCGLEATDGALGVWGRGAFTRVSGRAGAMSLNADVTTATLGADYGWASGIQAGLLLAHSQSAGAFDAYAVSGEASSRLTALYPYVSYRLASSRLWALAGAGRGLVEVEGEEVLETEVGSTLLAAGTIGRVATGRRVQLAYEGDVFLARAEAEERVQVSRIRAGMEGSVALGRSLRPYLEAALRHDGGDAETGLGLEAGGGLRLQHSGGRLRAELSSRGLLTHASSELAEWGVAAALHYGAPQGLGPTAEIRPVWGAARSGGRQALWRHDAIADAAIGMPGRKRIEVRLGYGTPLANGVGVARPILAVTLRGSGRDYRLGYEVATQSGFTVSAAGTAWESSPWRPVSYGLTARAALRW